MGRPPTAKSGWRGRHRVFSSLPRTGRRWSPAPSDIHFLHLRRALHDEREARRDVATHERLDRLIRARFVGDRNPQEGTPRGVERRLLERPGVHLAEPLEPGHLHALALAVAAPQPPVLLGVRAATVEPLA